MSLADTVADLLMFFNTFSQPTGRTSDIPGIAACSINPGTIVLNDVYINN